MRERRALLPPASVGEQQDLDTWFQASPIPFQTELRLLANGMAKLQWLAHFLWDGEWNWSS
jgi:hypothetical protein